MKIEIVHDGLLYTIWPVLLAHICVITGYKEKSPVTGRREHCISYIRYEDKEREKACAIVHTGMLTQNIA